MSDGNGKRRPPRPRIEVVWPAHHPAGGGREAEQPAGVGSEAAAIVAALEQFLVETAPAPEPSDTMSPWLRAALEDGIAARQVSGFAWGHSPR
jgi:hypothetical protein